MKAFFADAALVCVVLLGLVFLGGLVNGEAGVWPVIFALAGFCFSLLLRKVGLKSKAQVKRVTVNSFSDFKHAA